MIEWLHGMTVHGARSTSGLLASALLGVAACGCRAGAAQPQRCAIREVEPRADRRARRGSVTVELAPAVGEVADRRAAPIRRSW